MCTWSALIIHRWDARIAARYKRLIAAALQPS